MLGSLLGIPSLTSTTIGSRLLHIPPFAGTAISGWLLHVGPGFTGTPNPATNLPPWDRSYNRQGTGTRNNGEKFHV